MITISFVALKGMFKKPTYINFCFS